MTLMQSNADYRRFSIRVNLLDLRNLRSISFYFMIFNCKIDFDHTKNDPVNLQLNSLEVSVLNLLQKNKNITYDELIEALGKSRKIIQRAISKLKSLNLIERGGSDKSGYWQMK